MADSGTEVLQMRRLVLLAFASAAVAVIVWWFSHRPPVRPVPQTTTSARGVAPAAPTPAALPSLAAPSYEVPPGGAYEGLNDPRWQWWNAMKNVDSSSEWKIPINFYGRVVDENGQAVAGATVRFGWPDTSARGSSEIVNCSYKRRCQQTRGRSARYPRKVIRRSRYCNRSLSRCGRRPRV